MPTRFDRAWHQVWLDVESMRPEARPALRKKITSAAFALAAMLKEAEITSEQDVTNLMLEAMRDPDVRF